MTPRLPALLLAVGITLCTGLTAEAQPSKSGDWGKVAAPAPGPPRIFGSYTNGCIAGARSLPTEGPGHQVVRLSRNRYFGHPETVDYLLNLGRRVAGAGLGIALIGDMSQPRGGPMAFGHASHEIGLDADVWFRLDLPPLPRSGRENLDLPSMVDFAARRVDPRRFTAKQADLVRFAAMDPRVARIFVNPAIKQALCERPWSDRSWLRLVRPWHGHDAHFHVRLNCPADQPDCVSQDAPPEGDGCGTELAEWLAKLTPPAKAPSKPRSAPSRPAPAPVPAACTSVLAMPPR
ncbi:penicillin-insensitive murein endopeptidase [Skermanella rosea]|uniref:penicillin-insensitive murein endopeptidase n=1 Tax=Skermanella rosea TaxID=1817965 RepID=UPI001E30E019|nr:penicillin-insensitive murein endopeptidase [Skermanella rosea]UEM06419.1 penicillin-insensitive murein endopeptidase [Skermanella rosea]